MSGPDDGPQNVHFTEMVEELTILRQETGEQRKNVFLFANVSDALIKSYTGVDRPGFENVVCMIDHFCPLQYWSGTAVPLISKQDHFLLVII